MTARCGRNSSGVRGPRTHPGGSIRPGRRAAACCAIASALLFAFVFVAAAAPGTTFASKRYGYAIVLPGKQSRWFSTFATRNWTSGEIEHGSPEFDTFTDGQGGRIYFLAAARPHSSSLQQWTAFIISARPAPPCGEPQLLPNSTLAGSRARVLTWSCSDGYRVFVITALRAHRGYVMLVASPSNFSRASDRRAFDAARRSFRFLNK